jgi:hypothetical protein
MNDKSNPVTVYDKTSKKIEAAIRYYFSSLANLSSCEK